jgi:hypothetical protein
LPASVTHIEWFDEEKEFAIAFTDGVMKLGRKNQNFQPISISAHQVSWKFVTDVSCRIMLFLKYCTEHNKHGNLAKQDLNVLRLRFFREESREQIIIQ